MSHSSSFPSSSSLCGRPPKHGVKTRWTSPNTRSTPRWTPSLPAPRPWSTSPQVIFNCVANRVPFCMFPW
uniref:Uncharacterized protein n=1 Tax=Anguilla anguilla TaxID=7936 RepID=A0A0E9S420_ANGAN